MNEGTGSTLFDVAKVDNLSLAGGTPTWASNAGFPGSTLQFPASGTATSALVGPTAFDGTKPFTVAFWVEETTQVLAQADQWIDSSVGLSAPGLYIRRGGNSQEVQVVFGGPFPTNSAFIRVLTGSGTPILITPNNLFYVAVTYDGSLTTNGLSIYINGVLQLVGQNTATLASAVTTTTPLTVKFDGGNAGTIAFLETYNAALSAVRLAANYAAGPGIR